MADRRDLPRVVVALHLRSGLPGRAHRAGARARPGLLLVRRARSDKKDREHVEKLAEELADDEWQFAQARAEEGRLDEGRQGRPTGAPGSSTARASSSTGPASRAGPGCALHQCARCDTGKHFSETEARRSAGSSRCGASTSAQEDGRSISTCSPSSVATAGARAARSSRGGAPRPGGVHRARARLPVDGARAAAHARRRRCSSGWPAYLDDALAAAARRRWCTRPR